jgi:hypothetical protein
MMMLNCFILIKGDRSVLYYDLKEMINERKNL